MKKKPTVWAENNLRKNDNLKDYQPWSLTKCTKKTTVWAKKNLRTIIQQQQQQQQQRLRDLNNSNKTDSISTNWRVQSAVNVNWLLLQLVMASFGFNTLDIIRSIFTALWFPLSPPPLCLLRYEPQSDKRFSSFTTRSNLYLGDVQIDKALDFSPNRFYVHVVKCSIFFIRRAKTVYIDLWENDSYNILCLILFVHIKKK